MSYRFRSKVYQNPVDGVRYNCSLSHVPEPKPVHELSEEEFEHARLCHYAVLPQFYIPTMGTGKLGHKVYAQKPRDQSSVYRSIREIRDLGVSNTWDYFFTFTLDPHKWDRSDYMIPGQKIMQFFKNRRRGDDGYDAKLVMIPELHKDRTNYHFHGMIKGIPDQFVFPHPYRWERSQGYLDLPDISSRFGLVTLSPVKDTAAVVYYCLKYVNKDIGLGKVNDGRKLYFCSRGLNRPQIVDDVVGLNLTISDSRLSQFMEVTEHSTGFQRRMTQEDKDILFQKVLGIHAEPKGVYDAQIPERHWKDDTDHGEENGGYYSLFGGSDSL